jgi:DNA replication protein DnaC
MAAMMERTERNQKIRANIQDSLKPLLEKADYEAAKKYVKDLPDSEQQAIAIEIMKENPPNDTCELCGERIEWEFLPGYLSWGKKPYCSGCQWQTMQETIKNSLPEILHNLGVGARFLKADISDFPKNYQSLIDRENGLYISGPRGVGKTHLVVAIMKQMVLNHPRAAGVTYRLLPSMISVPELLLRIKATYQKNADEDEGSVIDFYSEKKILVLDDLGTEKPTDWVLSTLYLIIDRRYRNMKTTYITSNFNLDQIAERLDDRISSRIAEMCDMVNIKGKDRRVRA